MANLHYSDKSCFSQVHGLGIYTVGFLEPVAGVHGFSIEIYLQRKFNHSLDMLPLLPGK